SKKTGASWISADMIESMILPYIPNSKLETMFPKRIIRKQTKQSNDLMYSKYTIKQIAEAYIRQAKSSWDAIEMAVEVAIYENHDLIIEGHQVHPALISKMIKRFAKQIKGLVITRHDTNMVAKCSRKFATKNDWFTCKTKNSDADIKIARMICVYSEYFTKEAEINKINIINVDNNFKKQIKHAVLDLVAK
ncbi:MAG: hypothetical protein ABIH21_00410, partial [Patescibacteria group bacterium]